MICVLKTNIGAIGLYVNGKKQDFVPTELPRYGENYIVDGRYAITIKNSDLPDGNFEVECCLNSDKVCESGVNSGEDLALIDITADNEILSIGTYDGYARPYECKYTKNGIKIVANKADYAQDIIFLVAWLKMEDEEVESIYTWFAADPALLN